MMGMRIRRQLRRILRSRPSSHTEIRRCKGRGWVGPLPSARAQPEYSQSAFTVISAELQVDGQHHERRARIDHSRPTFAR